VLHDFEGSHGLKVANKWLRRFEVPGKQVFTIRVGPPKIVPNETGVALLASMTRFRRDYQVNSYAHIRKKSRRSLGQLGKRFPIRIGQLFRRRVGAGHPLKCSMKGIQQQLQSPYKRGNLNSGWSLFF
jgi:hypothetical protein